MSVPLAGLDTGFKMNINDNTILITGGSSGIGFEMAKQFLKRNNKVIITGRNKQKLEKSKQQLDGVTAIQNDVSNPDDVEKLYQQVAKDFPDLNILINNAGIMPNLSFSSRFMRVLYRVLCPSLNLNALGRFLSDRMRSNVTDNNFLSLLNIFLAIRG